MNWELRWRLATLAVEAEIAIKKAEVELSESAHTDRLRGSKQHRRVRRMEAVLGEVDMAITNIREVLP